MKLFWRAICYLPLFIVFVLFLWQDFAFLFQSNAATGIDGYYYVLQVETLLNTGEVYIPTYTPVVIYLLAALSFLIGNTIVAIKVGALTLQIGLCFGVARLIHNLTKSIWLASLGVFILMFSA